MTISMHASLTAIGRQLKASYRPTLAKPLPSKLEGLLAQLVAFETASDDRRSVVVTSQLPRRR